MLLFTLLQSLPSKCTLPVSFFLFLLVSAFVSVGNGATILSRVRVNYNKDNGDTLFFLFLKINSGLFIVYKNNKNNEVF